MAANRRKTKIICTVGPATASSSIERLYEAGMSVGASQHVPASQDERRKYHWIKP